MLITARVETALADLPPILTPKQLGQLLGKSEDALACERWKGIGVPFTKYGRRVYYLKADVAQFFAAHRHNTDQQLRADHAKELSGEADQ